MILLSGDVVEIGTILVDTDSNEWVVVKFDEVEDPFYSQAVIISMEEMQVICEYIRVRWTKSFYTFDKSTTLKYIVGSEWDDYEERSESKYKNLFKPIEAISFMSRPKEEIKHES